MMAATPAAVQPALLPELESPARIASTGPAADVCDLQVAASGLVRHAEVRTSSDGRAHLTVQVLQAQNSVPFVAVFHGGPGDQLPLQRLAEQLLRPGAIALLRGEGLDLRPHGGEACLHLKRCRAVALIDAQPAGAKAFS